MNIKVIEGIKTGASALASIGISFLLGGLTAMVAGTCGGNAAKRALMALGGTVIAGMVIKQADGYISEEIDSAVEIANSFSQIMKESKGETETNG